ncbi:phage tail tip lysozyme [Sphingomonas aquatica]|uniref:phage tail tip lysozyme n=1 Tax=Sphingomonas aquatica TaxID=1763824 RepID=UPI00301BFA4C
MSDDTEVGVNIVGRDKTGPAIKSAEKRASELQKRSSRASEKAARDQQRTIGQSARGIVRTFSDVERAGAKVFGNRSVLSGAAARLGGISEAAAGLGSGLGEAAAAGGVLQGAIASVGVAVGATIGLIAAAIYGTWKLADGWAKNAAAIGRTASTIGVGTKAMQEFSAAAERAGVDRDKATGSLGSLSQTLNDARYGRNNAAIAMLSRLGVALKTNADGTVNVEAMLPAIADALARQNSSGRRTAAQALGISLDALPAFTQGGKQLAQDMKEAATQTAVYTDEDATIGQRIQRRQVTTYRKGEAAIFGKLRSDAIKGLDHVEDSAVRVFDGVIRNDFKPSAETTKRAAEKMERAAARIERASGYAAGAGRFSAGQIARLAQRAQGLRQRILAQGASPAEATALAANSILEGGGDHRRREKGGNGYGLFQITNRGRRENFRKRYGHPIEQSTEAEQIDFALYEIRHDPYESRQYQKALRGARTQGDLAAGYARYVERPANPDRDSAERAAVAEAMGPVQHSHEIKIYDHRTEVRSSTGSGKPSTSYAFQPVHGG